MKLASGFALRQVDAFTDTLFGGNPAAVCLLETEHLPLSDHTRQSVAAEMNLSETSFVEVLTEGRTFQDAE